MSKVGGTRPNPENKVISENGPQTRSGICQTGYTGSNVEAALGTETRNATCKCVLRRVIEKNLVQTEFFWSNVKKDLMNCPSIQS